MNPFVRDIAALHQQDLLGEARLERLVRLAPRSQPGSPAWRRSLGGLIASAARSLDPTFDLQQGPRRTASLGVDPLPAC